MISYWDSQAIFVELKVFITLKTKMELILKNIVDRLSLSGSLLFDGNKRILAWILR